MTDRVDAPVTDAQRLAKQKQILLDYVQEQALLPPDTLFRYVTHEYVSRPHHPTMVVLHLGLLRGEVEYEFTLEELQLYQGRRFTTSSDVTSSRPTAQVGQPASTSAPASRVPASLVDQTSWSTNREALFANVNAIEPDARRYVSMEIDDGRRQMRCRCISGAQTHLCQHLQFVYTTGWERDKLLDESGSEKLRSIRLPIGMGEVYIDLEAEIMEDDTLPLGRQRTGYVCIRNSPLGRGEITLLPKLAAEISPFPREVDHVILAPGEGTIKAIRYIEGLLRATRPYQNLVALSPVTSGSSFTQVNMVCRRSHSGDTGMKLVSEFIAGMRPSNPHRESWMVACAYTLFMSGLCLPCHRATSSSVNVPVF